MRILVVCTANVCRSPMAAALLGRQCTQRGLPVYVRSAGTHAGIAALEPAMIAAMAARDIDLSKHRPRLLVRQLLDDDGHDMIVTMTREHLRAVTIMAPAVLGRTFTAKELARRAPAVRPRADADGEPSVAEWIAMAGQGRLLKNLMGSDPSDDVEDPYSQSLARHLRSADELDGLMATVAGSLAMWLT